MYKKPNEKKERKKFFTKLEIRQEKKSLKNDSERNEGGGVQVKSSQVRSDR